MSLFRREPAAVLALFQAALAALVIPDAWAKLVMAAVALALGGATRAAVYAPASVETLTKGPG